MGQRHTQPSTSRRHSSTAPAYESNVLRRAYRNQERYTRSAEQDIDTNFALAVREPWHMSPNHMDYEVHEQQWIPKQQAGLVSAAQYMNEVALGLEKQVLPREGTLEPELLNIIPANAGWESYIIGDMSPRPARRSTITIAQLNHDSVVHQVARVISATIFPGGVAPEQITRLTQSILDHYLEMHMDPMILVADVDPLHMPAFQDQIRLAAMEQQCANPELADFHTLLDHSQDLAIMMFALIYYEKNLVQHKRNRTDVFTGKYLSPEPVLAIEDRLLELAFRENLIALMSCVKEHAPEYRLDDMSRNLFNVCGKGTRTLGRPEPRFASFCIVFRINAK